MGNKRSKRFQKDIKDVFSSGKGLYILKCLKEDYVDSSQFTVNQHEMAYKCGQKDLVQEIISTLESTEDLDNLDMTDYYDI